MKNAAPVERDQPTENLGAPAIPTIENIHQRVYEAASAPQALDMSNWHTCGTTHCRAGWVVHLAGKAGYALERFHNTALAAQLIYRESGAPINPARFYDNNDDALADMKRLAELSSPIAETNFENVSNALRASVVPSTESTRLIR